MINYQNQEDMVFSVVKDPLKETGYSKAWNGLGPTPCPPAPPPMHEAVD